MCVISGIRQAAGPLCDRVGVPDLGNATVEDHENQELVSLAPGACHAGVGSPPGTKTAAGRPPGLTSSERCLSAHSVEWSALDYRVCRLCTVGAIPVTFSIPGLISAPDNSLKFRSETWLYGFSTPRSVLRGHQAFPLCFRCGTVPCTCMAIFMGPFFAL